MMRTDIFKTSLSWLFSSTSLFTWFYFSGRHWMDYSSIRDTNSSLQGWIEIVNFNGSTWTFFKVQICRHFKMCTQASVTKKYFSLYLWEKKIFIVQCRSWTFLRSICFFSQVHFNRTATLKSCCSYTKWWNPVYHAYWGFYLIF